MSQSDFCPPPPHVRHRLDHMTWPEVAQAQEHAPLAIVPTGACEQHGWHMALRTDAARAEDLALRLAERLAPRAVVTPCLGIGVSEHHMGFPGTVTLSAETFARVLTEVVSSLYRHGWRYVFVLNGHGGNQAAAGVAVATLQARYPDLHLAYSGITGVVPDVAKEVATVAHASHSSEVETSQSLYVAPDLVREEWLAAHPDPADRYARVHPPAGVRAPRPFHTFSEDGATGRPSAATRVAGEKLVETAADRLCTFLTDFIANGSAGPHAEQKDL